MKIDIGFKLIHSITIVKGSRVFALLSINFLKQSNYYSLYRRKHLRRRKNAICLLRPFHQRLETASFHHMH